MITKTLILMVIYRINFENYYYRVAH